MDVSLLDVIKVFADIGGFCGAMASVLMGVVIYLVTLQGRKAKETEASLGESKETIRYVIEQLLAQQLLDDRPIERRYTGKPRK